MESLYRLNHAEQKFKGVVIAHDMTKTERDECKRLVAEAKIRKMMTHRGNLCTGYGDLQ